MWTVIYWLIVVSAGFCLGFLVRDLLSYKFRKYSGTLVVDTDEMTEKTVYSLVLDEYPEKLQFEKVVVFKVDRLDSPPPKGNRR